MEPLLLTINGGSSSIKFAAYRAEGPLERRVSGKLERIGLPGATVTYDDRIANDQGNFGLEAADTGTAARFLIDWLEARIGFAAVRAVGHRVVHGMHHMQPERITKELLEELRRICPYDPEHLPGSIELIEAFAGRYPELLQVACFDTAFHAGMPRVAKLLPIPRRFDAMGVRRYGFHGLSYEYLMEELARVAGEDAARGRVILAHLGNGASLAAVQGGKSIDTSMGFTPAGGVPMGTRPGDLDPGAAWYIMQAENMNAKEFSRVVTSESGLLGVSETSSDMRDLIARQNADVRAREAVELFCYQTRKWIGAFAAALGGVETLVFSGGIGENTGEVRERVCGGLGFLGIELDAARNAVNAPVISVEGRAATVRVIRTDEELTIARAVNRIIGEESRR